jgi:hypothetical protein
MKKNLLQTALEGMNEKVYFVLLLLYQLVFIFQGLDFADEGFYAVFYQQIFHDPQSLMLNFMYWFTGIVGGAFIYVFPQAGLLGMRILGVIVTTSTIFLAYKLLKKYVTVYHLRLAIWLIIILISNDPKELNYDNLSMLLFVATVTFLFNGLQENKSNKLLIGGALLGLNFFTRVTNILGLSLVLGIFYYAYINRNAFKLWIKQTAVFLGGFFLVIGLVLFIMKLINHLTPFADSIGIVLHMGTDEGSDHNIKIILFNFLKKYFLSFCYFSIMFVAGAIATVANNFLQSKTKTNLKPLTRILQISFFLLVCVLTVMGRIRWGSLLFFFMGFTLTASLLIIVNHRNNSIKLLTCLGFLILLFYPAGSDEFVEMFSFWIIFPIVLDYYFGVTALENKISIFQTGQQQTISLAISESQMNNIKKIFIYSCVFIGLFYTYYYPYFDISNRINMHYTVNHKYLKGIFTSKPRAKVIDELLSESARYVKKDDYVLAYDCIPMYHYLTETMPYMYNPWPEEYLPDVFQKQLQKALLDRKKLPVVIIQKLNTLNSKWPENTQENYAENKENQSRNNCMNDFLKNNHYQKVWENVAFEIRIPDVAQKQKMEMLK